MRDSWGGNSKTCLVATVSPSMTSQGETLSTLNFAQRAKLVRNTAVLNENTTGGNVAALTAEVTRLRDELRLREEQDRQLPIFEQNSLHNSFTDNAQNDAETLNSSSTIELYSSAGDDQYMKRYLNEKKLSTSLKRKVREETWVRKSKQARIDYLNKKRKG